jgi:hypothetical protein
MVSINAGISEVQSLSVMKPSKLQPPLEEALCRCNSSVQPVNADQIPGERVAVLFGELEEPGKHYVVQVNGLRLATGRTSTG